jgi:hypothetical protein
MEVHGNYLQSILEKAKQLLEPRRAQRSCDDVECSEWRSLDKVFESKCLENSRSGWSYHEGAIALTEPIRRSADCDESMMPSEEDGQIRFREQRADSLLHRFDAFRQQRLVMDGLSS